MLESCSIEFHTRAGTPWDIITNGERDQGHYQDHQYGGVEGKVEHHACNKLIYFQALNRLVVCSLLVVTSPLLGSRPPCTGEEQLDMT